MNLAVPRRCLTELARKTRRRDAYKSTADARAPPVSVQLYQRKTSAATSTQTMLIYVTAVLHLVLIASGQPVDAVKLQNVAQKTLESPLPTKRVIGSPSIRAKRTTDLITECMEVKSQEGHYFYKSTNDDDSVCGIYFFTEPDRTIEIYFNYLDVPCEDNGLVSFVDGWELNGEFFPSPQDHPKPMENRYSEICGKRKPKQVFQTAQNAAVIQYRVPTRGASFSFTVRFPKNRMPCNVLLQNAEDVYTLRNYGKRVNCSISAAFPAVVRILSLNVGLAGYHAGLELETGTIHKCQKRGLDDYVQIGGTHGLDTTELYVAENLCGIDSKPGIEHIMFCGFTTVRLVSSGAYDNSVTVSLRKAEEDDISPAATICELPDI